MYLIVSVFFSHSSALLCGTIDFLLLRQKKVRLEVQSLNRDNNGHLIITFLFLKLFVHSFINTEWVV